MHLRKLGTVKIISLAETMEEKATSTCTEIKANLPQVREAMLYLVEDINTFQYDFDCAMDEVKKRLKNLARQIKRLDPSLEEFHYCESKFKYFGQEMMAINDLLSKRLLASGSETLTVRKDVQRIEHTIKYLASHLNCLSFVQ